MRDLEIITANLKGTCVTQSNQVHGLFRLIRPQRSSTPCSAGEAVADALRGMAKELELKTK